MSDSNATAPTEEEMVALRAELDRISHPAAKIYSLLIDSDADGWKKLCAGIKENGQEHPIIFNRQSILLAGRNRWLACKMQGLKPKVEIRDLTGAAAVEFIRNDNDVRRHDDIATRGIQGAKLEEMKKADPKTFGAASTQVEAAKAEGMSDATYRVLQQIRKTNPDIAAELEKEKLSPHAAKKLSKKSQGEIDHALGAIRAAKNKQEGKKILKEMGFANAPSSKPKDRKGSSKSFDAAYAALFEEIDQLPKLFEKHPMSAQQLEELIGELRKALDLAVQTRRAQQTAAKEPKETEAADAHESEPAAA